MRSRAFCVAGALLALGISSAVAQYPVTQTGRLNEVNSMLGGGGANYVRPLSPLMSGNAFATGNVGRGLSLESYSPISSPTAFRAGLGSDSLSNFIRDSISPAYANAPGGGLLAMPYYDPSRTAPTGAYLQGYYNFQSTTPNQNINGAWTGTSPGVQSPSRYGAPPAMQSTYDTRYTAQNQTLGRPLDVSLSSSIFGVAPTRMPGPTDTPAMLPNASYVPPVAFDNWGMPREAAPATEGLDQLDQRIAGLTQTQGPAPLDPRIRNDAVRMLTERSAARPQAYNLMGTPAATDGVPQGLGQQIARVPDQAPRPGGDVFTDLRLAMDLTNNPDTEWFKTMQNAAGMGQRDPNNSSTDILQQQTQAVENAAEFLTRVYESPLSTFAGDDATALNLEIRQAEAAMDGGRYYDAARLYERAASIAPANPLPLLGKGHALLAAGEYMSAASCLLTALDRFPDVARFQEDLTALMGGGEIVDIRRADLMKMLDRNEDPQLRFLLGYLEMNTGMMESGMKHLEKAAENAPTNSMLRRYPDLVRHKLYFSARPASVPGTTPAAPALPAEAPPKENEGNHP